MVTKKCKRCKGIKHNFNDMSSSAHTSMNAKRRQRERHCMRREVVLRHTMLRSSL